MYKKKKKKKYLITIICLIIILILSYSFTYISDNRKLNKVESSLKNFGINIIKVFNYPVNYIKNFFDGSDKKECQNSGNEELNLYIDELEKEINELKNNMEIKNLDLDCKTIYASVISRNPGYWYNTFIIDKGTSDNVKTGNGVVINNSLVGTVTSVTKNTSTIKLISSDNINKISVKLKVDDDYIYGMLEKYDKENGEFIINGISSNKEISNDTIVSTTGYGNLYPSGLKIGRVVGIDYDDYHLTRTIRVKSDINFDNIGYVTVVLKEVKK